MDKQKKKAEIIDEINKTYEKIQNQYSYLDKLFLQLQDLANEEQQNKEE